MRRVLFAALAGFALSACSPRSSMESAPVPAQTAAMEAVSTDSMGGESNAPTGGVLAQPAREQGQDPDVRAATAPMLAYTYGADLELPFKNVRSAMARHEAACTAAGPSVCQVLGATVNVHGDDMITGAIELRARPKWLEGFRNGLEGDAKSAGGSVKGRSQTSEDLTRQIIDTDARLRAQKTLRERLQQILRTRPGKLSELLETERELARVQGEIDSAESTLAVMRQRVATSVLNLSYRSAANPVTGGAFRPVVDAVNDFIGTMMSGFGLIIRLIAWLIPVAAVATPLVWLSRRWRLGVAARKEAARKVV